MITGGDPSAFSSGRSLQDISSLSVAAHELKTPLALVRQLALELQGGDLPLEDRVVILEQIQLISEKALRLTSNIAKSEQLQIRLFPTTSLYPGAICNDVAKEITPLYAAAGRVLSVSSKAQRLVVANHDLLRRVLLNFADNALHYSSEQGVVELYTQLRRKEDVVRFGVRDYGPVLPAKVWRQLNQGISGDADTGDSARPDSSGLGLVIAHRFAEALEGNIGAIRHRDGASFYIDLPISKQLALL
ncbi:MAG TPA: HAMP domain-containing sensor histidine kinase [Candidatus Saccharimonadales bacterium]